MNRGLAERLCLYLLCAFAFIPVGCAARSAKVAHLVYPPECVKNVRLTGDCDPQGKCPFTFEPVCSKVKK